MQLYKIVNVLPRFLRKLIDPLTLAIDDFTLSGVRKLAQPSLVVDAGAGECRHKKLLAACDNVDYLSIDFLQGDAAWNYTEIDLLADLSNIPLKSDCVDILINNQVLEHVRYPALVLAEFNRILKPSGRLYLTVPQGWYEHQEPHDYFRFTRYGLAALAEETGFKVVDISPMGGAFCYVGNRLTYLTKLFRQLPTWARCILVPVEIVTILLFGVLIPAVFYQLDFLDQERKLTLGYAMIAKKPGASVG